MIIIATVFENTKNVAVEFLNYGIFNELLAIRNVNVARFARNFECDVFCNFQNYTGLALVPILQ